MEKKKESWPWDISTWVLSGESYFGLRPWIWVVWCCVGSVFPPHLLVYLFSNRNARLWGICVYRLRWLCDWQQPPLWNRLWNGERLKYFVTSHFPRWNQVASQRCSWQLTTCTALYFVSDFLLTQDLKTRSQIEKTSKKNCSTMSISLPDVSQQDSVPL